MSNPTVLVESFNGSLGAFVGVDPIRYDSGLWLEEAATNLNVNPIGSSGVGTGWVQAGTGSIGYADGFLWARRSGTAAVGQTATGTNRPAITAGQSISIRMDLFADATGVGRSGRLRVRFFDVSDAQVGEQIVDATLTASGQLFEITATAPANTTYAVPGFLFVGNGLANEEIRATNIFWWIKGYQTSVVPVLSAGTPVAGYAWTGTPHQSTSTRAASSASISPTGILDPATGSLAFRLTRKIDTGDIEYILNCGTDGDDRLRIYIDTDDRLRVAWDTGGALPQSVVSSSTIAVGTEYLVYTEWDGINIAMSLDAGTLVTGIRDVPLGSWGTDDLVLGP